MTDRSLSCSIQENKTLPFRRILQDNGFMTWFAFGRAKMAEKYFHRQKPGLKSGSFEGIYATAYEKRSLVGNHFPFS